MFSNTSGGAPGTVTGSNIETFSGMTANNPFAKSGRGGTSSPLSSFTPYIPNLTNGASPFGLLSGVTTRSADFASVVSREPANAVGAIIRRRLGPTGDSSDFISYDALLFINLTTSPLLNPFLGSDPLGSAYSEPLATLGTNAIARNLGATVLSSLGAYDVWETLIPTGGSFITAGATDVNGINDFSMANGDVAYLTAADPVPEPATVGLLGMALACLAGVRRRR